MRLVAIVAGVVLSVLATGTADASAAAPPCASADALQAAGQTDEAIKQYVSLLKKQPELACALAGLRAIATASDARDQASTMAKCDAADELADADERDAAKALYIEALKAGDSCGRAGLDLLDETRPWHERWKDRLGDATSGLAVLATPLIVALLLVAFLYAILTYIGPFRRRWRRLRFLGHPLQPRLRIGEFDDGSNPSMSESVAGVLRSTLSALGRDQQRNRDDYRLDVATGAEGIDTAVASLGDVAPQFKAIAGVLTFARQIARSPRYELYGAVQRPRGECCGLTVSLDRVRGSASTSTLWDDEKPKEADRPVRVYYLAAVAAGWADFRLRQREQLELPEGFKTAESYGHFRAGVESERHEDYVGAFNAYRNALLHDRRNVPALLNLARLEGRSHHYPRARKLLDYAIDVLAHELDG
jgi:tetratricopeptide (TPR) repeat protein